MEDHKGQRSGLMQKLVYCCKSLVKYYLLVVIIGRKWQAKKGMYITGMSCKSKFEKLAFTKCPTGTADIPIHVLQAKQLKEEISGYEVIGFVSGNKPEFDHDDDEYDSTNLLSPSKSCDGGTDEVKRPGTK